MGVSQSQPSKILVCWIWLWVDFQIVVIEPPLRFFASDAPTLHVMSTDFPKLGIGAQFRWASLPLPPSISLQNPIPLPLA